MGDYPSITIIGAGLAGCEAAWQAARAGLDVTLYEMKPGRYSEAHHSPLLGELVCSNSLRGADLSNAVGLLKEELRRCDTLFMRAADANRVPAGGALAVDREGFSASITEQIESHPRIELIREEVTQMPQQGITILASGPLTDGALAQELAALVGGDTLYFYDAIAPIIEADSIDFDKAWRGSRYDKGGDDYVNCPLDEDQYREFVNGLIAGDKVPARAFEKLVHFEGCMPIEEMAARGEKTLAFGPLKPVGLVDPRSGREPYAVVQLRQDDRHATLYNMVGFQTRLKHPEQQRLFRTIPGLESARFARLGSMHRNTYVNAPRSLERSLQLKGHPQLFLAGQITGVEGYVESAASGFLAGLFAARHAIGAPFPFPPEITGCGALVGHLASAGADDFQPMNINYGLFPPLERRIRSRRERRLAMAERALEACDAWCRELRLGTGDAP